VNAVAVQGRTESAREVRVSVVVPVFNSAASLGELCERIAATMDSAAAATAWELILVNDGSGDGSWERVVALSREMTEVRGIDLTRNWGQHGALLAGVHAARGEVIVTLDDDLQNPPEEIPKLLDALGPEADVVYGIPAVSAHPAHRRIGGAALRGILRVLSGRPEALLGSGFRAFRSELAERLRHDAGQNFVLDPALRDLTDRVGSVEVRHEERRIGRSNYTLGMLVRLAFVEIATDLPFRRSRGPRDPSYRVRTVTEPQPSRHGR
jgi:undecaprenyl-phosphate 4-deoxy-4-formamido-L-arabinose transferase